jgi:hypothetical protein
LQSSLDALKEVYLTRISELKAKIYALISKANLTHQTNPVRKAAPIKTGPTIVSRVIEPPKNTFTPQIQRQPSILITQTRKPITIAVNYSEKNCRKFYREKILRKIFAHIFANRVMYYFARKFSRKFF